MSEEVLIPKMRRREKYSPEIKIPMLNIAVIIFCSVLITAATFVNIEIRHYIIPVCIFSGKCLSVEDFIYAFCFIPQVPMVMFVCSVLGRKMALTSVIIYILAGLFFVPVFALGGGFKYIFEYGFGYIVAYIPAVIFAGNLLKKYSFSDMIKSAFAGVFVIHVIGVIYMIIIALFKHSGGGFIAGWIGAQSGLKIVYDLIISFLAILVGKYLHYALKFVIE